MFSRFVLFGIVLMFLVTGSIFNGCKDNSTSSYGGSSSGGGNPPDNQIWIQNISFNPGTKTISKGTKITWVNKDSYAHTVTSGTPGNPDGIFDSGNIGGGATFSYTFNTSGTFKYYCRIHGMSATIIVQ